MSYIKKNELVILSQVVAFARDYIPPAAVWKWDKHTTWAEMLDKAHRTIWDLQTRYHANEKKLVERITEKRKASPEYRRQHCDASKKYYQKRKAQTQQGGQ
jgi:hypothetical protein